MEDFLFDVGAYRTAPFLYLKPETRGGVEGGNTAHSLLHTTLALGVFFVYVAPVADSHSFGFSIISPLHCDRLSPTIWTIPMFATHLVHVRL